MADIAFLFDFHMQMSSMMSLPVGKIPAEGDMENFQIIKYFDPNILALLSDNRAIEVASCRY